MQLPTFLETSEYTAANNTAGGLFQEKKTRTRVFHTEILKADIKIKKKMTYLISTSEPSYSVTTNNCNSFITNWL